MIVKEFLKKFKPEDMFEKIIEIRPYVLEFLLENEIVAFKENFKIAYKNLINIPYMENKEDILVCAKTKASSDLFQDDFEVSLFILEECKIGPYIFDGENCISRYSILFSPWDKILGTEICDMSIKLYGELTVASLIFYELIKMGISNDSRNEHIKKEIDILTSRMNELEKNNFEGCIDADDLFAEINEEIAIELENKGDFEGAEEIRKSKDKEKSEEDDKNLINSIYENQNTLFAFKEYILKKYL